MTTTLFRNSYKSLNKIAITSDNYKFSYNDLHHYSSDISKLIKQSLNLTSDQDINEIRIAYLIPSTFDYASIQWGIWKSGGIALPLCTTHPANELEYFIKDSDTKLILTHPNYEAIIKPLADALKIKTITIPSKKPLLTTHIIGAEPKLNLNRRAMLIYTSGTTSRPKGVVYTFSMLDAQVKALSTAWKWTKNDYIMNILPLHHIHGVINIISCGLFNAAHINMLPKFHAPTVWNLFKNEPYTLFMAVPTVYSKLISEYNSMISTEQKECQIACNKFRLMVSGSMALPISVLESWKKISGHTLLERYGMTEIGMALSNPLEGVRKPGFVGKPLPGVEVKTDPNTGELFVKGESVFKEYWGKPDATKSAFVDGWFATGDIVAIEDGDYKIVGRASVDVLKVSGYKISALDIERDLLEHEDIEDAAVMGIPDDTGVYGENIAVIIVSKSKKLTLDQLKAWVQSRMAPYKIPRLFLSVDEIPRNAMGKVNKKELKSLFIKKL